MEATMPYKDPEKRREAWRRWKQRNPEKVKANNAKWREGDYVKLNKQQENLNQKHRRRLIKERGEACERCKILVVPVEMHHIDNDNRNNRDDNLILLCKKCHRGKHKDVLSP
jgi:hypothetical protein